MSSSEKLPAQSGQNAANPASTPDLAAIDALRHENFELRRTLEALQGDLSSLRKDYEGFHKSFEVTIRQFVLASEYQDNTIENHVRRIGKYTSIIAEKAGLSSSESELIRMASPMHDVGKISVPHSILFKPGRLTDDEFSVVKLHTVVGGRMLAHSRSRLLAKAREIALSHHENWDGTGYPLRTRGRRIPLSGRIVGLVDMFDALTSSKAHKQPYPMDVAFDMIRAMRGKRFDPELVDTLQNNLDLFIRAKADIDTPDSIAGTEYALSERDKAPSIVR